MNESLIFTYQWHIDPLEKDVTVIRIYGVDENNKSICIRVDDFTPYVYIELPSVVGGWTAATISRVGVKIDEMCGGGRPLKKQLVYKKRLYGAHVEEDGARKTFPYLFCSFSCAEDIRKLSWKLKGVVRVPDVGSIQLKMHESDASPILQLTCCRGISTAGWVAFRGKEVSERETICDREYKVKWKHLSPHISNKLPKPLIMGFDIEVNSHNPGKFPDAKEPGDKVFQISCVLSHDGDPPEKYRPYLLTLGDPDPLIVGEGVEIRTFKTEWQLLVGWTKLIRESGAQIIMGYNILGFDIPYMIDRCKEVNMCLSDFDIQGFHKYNHAREKTIKWSSSAFKNQEFQFLDAEGRLFVDLLPLVKNNYKMNNYKLKTVSEYFIGETKDPLSVAGIFKCFRLGTIAEADGTFAPRARKAMGICGKYCVQDSVLTMRLMDKLKIWPGLTEMAGVCGIPIFDLYTKGQQIRVYSQVYKFCMANNIVVEKDGYQCAENERYIGAHVFPPVPGQYEHVVPFDFASLYPTTIIAYNIDYHTHVTDPSIPDEKCNVFEWQDCVGCCHDPKVIRVVELSDYINGAQDEIKKLRGVKNKAKGPAKERMEAEINTKVAELKPYSAERAEINKTKPKFPMCEKRKFRFLKEPKGVIPTVIQNLLDARKHTRKVDMRAAKDEIAKIQLCPVIDDVGTARIVELEQLLEVLDKRQLAFKMSSNAIYGSFGVRRGYLPFMPAAMCFAGDTKISSGYGFTREIKSLTSTDNLWSYNGEGQIIANGGGLEYKGKKDVVKITLSDGRTIRCTPDHRIMTTDGWVEAGKLISSHNWDGEKLDISPTSSKVVVGLELPEDIQGDDEIGWGVLDYTMDTPENREKALAFARVLGFILADGTLGVYARKGEKERPSCSVAFGTLACANLFQTDMKLLTGKEPSIKSYSSERNVSETIFRLDPPTPFVRQIVKLGGIPLGKRTHQAFTLPDFILDVKCPLAIVREFLGGVFGGDGSCPGLCITHPNIAFTSIRLGWTTIEKYKNSMSITMNNMIRLLGRLGLTFTNHMPRKRIDTDRLQAKDVDENPRWTYTIASRTSDILLFAQTVGYRYCIDKNVKLSVAASYCRFKRNVKSQRVKVVSRATDMHNALPTCRTKSRAVCCTEAATELYESDIPLHSIYSFSNSDNVNSCKKTPLTLESCQLRTGKFPTAQEYSESVGCRQFFTNGVGQAPVYSVGRYDEEVPCMNLGVVDVRNDGYEDVYDIVDMPDQSFLANGVVVHNCTTFMGRKNIEKVAKVIPERFGGQLVYGDQSVPKRGRL